MINPKLEEYVSKDTVTKFMNDLLYIAIDMNLSKYSARVGHILDININYRFIEITRGKQGKIGRT